MDGLLKISRYPAALWVSGLPVDVSPAPLGPPVGVEHS
jgi:hypothetical protein